MGQGTGGTESVEFEVFDGASGATFEVGRRSDGTIAQEIVNAYNNAGGEAVLGRALGLVFDGQNSASGRPNELQEFPNGNIYRWKDGPRQGQTYVVKGSIYATWFAQGRQTGSLGLPISNEQPALGSSTGVVGTEQYFEGGRIIALPDRPQAYFVIGAIEAKWASLGHQTGPLGLPISEEYEAAGSPTGVRSRIQEFENGYIYLHIDGPRAGNAYAVQGEIAKKWFNMGRSTSWLGLPIADEEAALASLVLGTSGRMQRFERGLLYKTTSGIRNGQVFAVRENILNKWNDLGGTTGYLGSPTSDLQVVDNGRFTSDGFLQEFEGGNMVIRGGDDNGTPIAILGKVYDRWFQMGRQTGELGFPTSDAGLQSIGRFTRSGFLQEFEGGNVTLTGTDPSQGTAYAVTLRIYDRWFAKGRQTGDLGFPTSERMTLNNGRFAANGFLQEFEGGNVVLVGTDASQGNAYSIVLKIYERWFAMGRQTGPLGFAKGELVRVTNGRFNPNGFIQTFEGGDIALTGDDVSQGTAYSVHGRIYECWFNSGRQTGYLGFPIAEQSGGVRQNQQFEGGALTDDVVRSANYPAGLNLVTIPRDLSRLSSADLLNLFQLPTDSNKIAVWDANAQRYVLIGEGFDGPRTGQGMWIRTTQSLSVCFPDELPAVRRWNLMPGWNLVGNPGDEDMGFDVTRIRVIQDGVDRGTLKEVVLTNVATPPVSPLVWIYDNASAAYQVVTDTAFDLANISAFVPTFVVKSAIPKGAGCWIFCRVSNLSLQLDASTFASPVLRGQETIREKPLHNFNNNRWVVQLTAQAGRAHDGMASFGVTDTRIPMGVGFAQKPPPPASEAGFVRMTFNRAQDDNLAYDIRPAADDTHQWDLFVTTNQPNEEVILSWPRLSATPKHLRFTLVDLVTGRRQFMNTTSGYRYRSAPDALTRRFRIEVNAESANRLSFQNITIQTVRTSTIPSLHVAYTLTRNANVGIRIMNAAGKVLNQLPPQPSRPGLNATIIAAADSLGRTPARGVYLLDITARADDGEEVKALKSVMLR